jgi:hypothetical protein
MYEFCLRHSQRSISIANYELQLVLAASSKSPGLHSRQNKNIWFDQLTIKNKVCMNYIYVKHPLLLLRKHCILRWKDRSLYTANVRYLLF